MMKDENEKYYWKNEKGNLIPKNSLSNADICNIVIKYGKKYLEENGHKLIVKRFEAMTFDVVFELVRNTPSISSQLKF